MVNTKTEIKTKANELLTILNLIADDPSIPEEKKISTIIHITSLVCAIVAVQPLPFADIIILTPIQVVMVLAMSRVMGNPMGKHGAGELLASLTGVVGWGLVAQQTVLGLYKIGLPFLAGFTTIPLVYGVTVGLGYAAFTILDVRRKDQKISDEEIRRIKTEYESKAKKEKRDWSPQALKNEIEEWKRKTEKYESYINELKTQDNEFVKFKNQYKESENTLVEYKNKIVELEKEKDNLLEKLKSSVSGDDYLSEIKQKDELQKIIKEYSQKHKELEEKNNYDKAQYDKFLEKRVDTIRNRYKRCYSNIIIDDYIYKQIADFNNDRLSYFEKVIGCLHHTPDKAVRDKIKGITDVLEFDFANDGRGYFKIEGNRILIYRIGNKSTQAHDIEWLRKNAK